MNYSLLPLTIAVILSCAASAGAGTYGYSASLSAYDTFTPDPAKNSSHPIALNLSGTVNVSGSATYDLGLDNLGLQLYLKAAYKGEAFIRAGNHQMGLQMDGYVDWTGNASPRFNTSVPGISMTAEVRSYDRIKALYRGTGPIPDLWKLGLLLNYKADGSMFTTFGNQSLDDPDHRSGVQGSLFFQSNALDKFINRNIGENALGALFEGTQLSVLPGVQLRAPLSGDSSGGFNTVEFDFLVKLVGVSSNGRFEFPLFHTVTLESVTFADGTTPESHGFDLVFASGLPSPNLEITAVPEPGTASLWATIMAIGSAVRCKSRKRSCCR